MLWTVFAILVVLWLLGWGFHVAGNFIHILFALALLVVLISLFSRRSPA